MLYKKLSVLVVLTLIAAASIFGLRSWVSNKAPQSAPTASATPTASTSVPTTVPSTTPSATSKPKPTQKAADDPKAIRPPAAKRTSTDYIVRQVAAKLNARSAVNIHVVCPPTIRLVAQSVFVCQVHGTAADGKVALARVTVRIMDTSGRFTWKSVSLR